MTAKPEQLYVDSYYTEYHAPRILMEQGLEERLGRIDHCQHPALSGKDFFVQGESINADGTVTYKLKEIEDD